MRLVRRDPDRRGERALRQPRLLVRSKIRRDERTARGLPSPIEVTVTERVELDRCADYFTTSETETPVYSASPRVRGALPQLEALRP